MISYDSVSFVVGDGKENKETPISFKFREADQNFYFIPQEILDRGKALQTGTTFFPDVLKDSFAKDFAESGQNFSVDQLASTGKGSKFLEDFSKGNYQSGQGIVVPESFYNDYFREARFLEHTGPSEKDPIGYAGISGISERNGKKIYAVQAYGQSNVKSWLGLDNEGKSVGYWEIPGEKWYNTTLGRIGIGLITGGALGMAGIGPFAGSAAGAGAAGAGAAGAGAAGTGLTVGAGGATGLTAGAAGVTGLTAPAGFTLAPGVGAAVGAGTAAAVGAGTGGGGSAGGTGLLDTAQFGQTGQTGITPGAVGQGLQTPTTPGLSSMGGGTGLTVPVSGGTVSQLGFVPTGSTPVLGDPKSFVNNPNVLDNTVFTTDSLTAPGAASGLSASDALRIANQAKGLLGAGENPLVPQQQGLPGGGRAGGQVDYSGLLALLQARARTPGVTSLLAPAQLSPMYQSLLPPNTMSLLG